jgi:hypothetical protein
MADEAWNSQVARNLIPDYYTLELTGTASYFNYGNAETALTLVLRGKDPGLYHSNTIATGISSDTDADVSISAGRGWFMRDPRDAQSSDLAGTQIQSSAQLGAKVIVGADVGISSDVGITDKGKPVAATLKGTVSFGLGWKTLIPISGAVGVGETASMNPLIKF